MRPAHIGCLLLAILAGPARARSPGETPAEAPPVADGVALDPLSGMVFLSPTALMPPAGSFSVHSHELVFIGGSYSITDDVSISTTVLIPITSELYLGMASAKLGIIQSDRFHLAAHGSLWGSRVDIGGDGPASSFGFAAAGAAATLCLDDACDSYLNGYVATGLGSEGDGPAYPVVVTGGWVQRLGQSGLKLAVEVDSGLVLGELDAAGQGVVAWYGLRFNGSSVAANLGMVKPLCDTCADAFPLGIPWVAFAYRGLPAR